MLAYRSTFTVGTPVAAAILRVQAIMIDWVERKHGRFLGTGSLDGLVPGACLRPNDRLELVLSDVTEGSGDRIFAFRCRETERGGEAAWTSQVTVAGLPSTDDRCLVSVELDAPPSPKDPLRPKNAAVPRYVRTILKRFDCNDNGVRLCSGPQVLDVEGVPSLLKELEEDDHHSLVLVAGSDESLPLDSWGEFIKNITTQTVGQAATYVLDPEATRSFNSQVSKRHVVMEGSLRTFVPGARFSDPEDGVRHRFLTTATLADDALRERASRVLERRSRAFTNARQQDQRVRRYLALAVRHLDEIVYEATATVEPVPVPPVEGLSSHAPMVDVDPQVKERLEEFERLVSAQKSLLVDVRTELSEAHKRVGLLERRVVSSDALVAQLTADLDHRTQERDDLTLDYAVATEEKGRAFALVRKQQAEINRLRVEFQKVGRGEEAWAGVSDDIETSPPDGWLELADWAEKGVLACHMPYIEFTCNWEKAIDLDDQNEIAWVVRTWNILHALNDYACARQSQDLKVVNLREYLHHPPEGYRTVSSRWYKPKESETVDNRRKYRRERMFNVPDVIPERDDKGRIYMDKHFVIAKSGMVSPRLYLHDATGVPGYGKIVVGYIGRHLPNDQTN